MAMYCNFGFRLSVLFVALVSTRVNAACIDPAQLAHSTVSIMRSFDDGERGARPDLMGVRGTGWFLSPTTLVTAEHVSKAMKLTAVDWKLLEIIDGDVHEFISARIQRLAGATAEKLAVIELQRSISDVRSIAIRKEPLMPDEQVMTIAYPDGRLHFAGGRFVRFGDDGKLADMALLEIYEGENRLVIDQGASGAPVIDCAGRIAAVVSNVFTQSLFWASREIKISTAWGTPNVVSVPVEALENASRAD
jgi:hypothetical protein